MSRKRERGRGDVVHSVSPLYSWVDHDGQNPGSNSGTRTTFSMYEVIIDEVGDPKEDHPCFHSLSRYHDLGMGGAESNDWNVVKAHGPSWMPYVAFPALPAIPPGKLTSYTKQLVEQWTNNPPPVINMAVNIAELKQTLSIPKQLANLTKNFDRFMDNGLFRSAYLRAGLHNLSGRNLVRAARQLMQEFDKLGKTVPKDVGNAYLIWKFGIAPLLEDIRKVPTLIASVVTRLEKLLESNNKWKRHSLTRGNVEWLTPEDIPSAFGFHEFKTVVRSGGCDLALSCEVRTSYTGLQACLDELRGTKKLGKAGMRAIAHALGLGHVPLLLWELVPWSFAVDWVANIGSFLDRWSPAQVPGSFETRKPVTSVKARVFFDRFYGNYCPTYEHFGTVYQNRPYKVGRGSTEAYTRSLSLPTAAISFQGLTPGQQMLAGALALQRLP